MSKRFIDRNSMRYNFLSWAAFLVLGLFIYGADIGLLDDAENRFLDRQFRWRGVVEADSRIVIAGIDQETLAWASRPMFSWGPLYAELVQAVETASASALMLDLVFSPGSENAIREHVKKIADRFELSLPQVFLRELGFDKPFRAALLSLVAAGIPVVAGFAWENNQPVFSDPALLHIARRENTGYFNLGTSRDGVIRSVEIFGSSSTGRVYAVSAVTASQSGLLPSRLPDQAWQQINYRGGRGTFAMIPVHRIIDSIRSGKPLPELRGRIVLVGFTDITDFKATPFGYMPGVEVHASIIDNLLNDRFLKPVPRLNEILALVVIMSALILLANFRRNAAFMAGLAVFATWLALAFFWFDSVVLPIVRPLLLIVTFIVGERLLAYRAIYLDRRRVKEIFGRYVSDAVVNEILSSNDRDFLRGRRRRLCVLIADIRGFTSFSERHDAQAVVEFLNAYFARLTEIIMNNRGVVDKFLGDGILAFFNAPVEHEDYADDAVNAAIQIVDYVSSPDFKAICHGASLEVGVALHAGVVVFGNIGSERKTEFTVIGDTVNACSRMESLNKEYGTSLLLSGEVVKSVKRPFPWKFLEKKGLRGKTNEVELYTVGDLEENKNNVSQ